MPPNSWRASPIVGSSRASGDMRGHFLRAPFREAQADLRSRPQPALDCQRSAMEFDEGARQGQADAATLEGAAQARIDLRERGQDRMNRVDGNADSAVANIDRRPE